MWKFAVVALAQLALLIPTVTATAQQAPDATTQAAPDEVSDDVSEQATEEIPDLDFSDIDLDAITRISPSGNAPRFPAPAASKSWNRTEDKTGAASVVQKQTWSNGIATNVGVDSPGAQPQWPAPGEVQAPSGSTAWANAAIPGFGLIDQTTLDARLDPDGDQRKFGARFQKSITLNPGVSLTLQNGFGVSQALAAQTITGVAPPPQVFDNEQLAKLNVLDFGTSLFAGTRQSSADDRRLNSFGAEQNLFGGVSVSGAVSENAAGGHDHSLSARFRRNW